MTIQAQKKESEQLSNEDFCYKKIEEVSEQVNCCFQATKGLETAKKRNFLQKLLELIYKNSEDPIDLDKLLEGESIPFFAANFK